MRKPPRRLLDRSRPAPARTLPEPPAPAAAVEVRAAAPAPSPWYRDGLQFGCTGCGACCRKAGYVWLGKADIAGLADHLGLSVDEFRARYTEEVAVPGQDRPGVHLVKAPHGCIFLDDATNGCTVYAARPTQCQTFPFWPRALESPEGWQQDVVALCGQEAVTQGHIYTVEEIGTIAGRIQGAGPGPSKPGAGSATGR